MNNNSNLLGSFSELESEVISCIRCPRLVDWREKVGVVKRKAYRGETYWSKPVPGFGDPKALVLVVGLAPGAHGSNRTGRMFTGDDSGKFLYPALWRTGFANQPHGSNTDDGLKLDKLWITAVCRCAPPENKPTPDEIINCRPFLEQEMRMLRTIRGVVALGKIAYDEILKGYDFSESQRKPVFKHGGLISAANQQPWVLASYHPSRQNTQTGRLTPDMFDQIWSTVNQLLLD